jgi:hypothetical protein
VPVPISKTPKASQAWSFETPTVELGFYNSYRNIVPDSKTPKASQAWSFETSTVNAALKGRMLIPSPS